MKYLVLSCILFWGHTCLLAQSSDAVVEFNTTNKGLNLPKVNLTATDLPAPLTQHVKGMMVYNTGVSGEVMEGPYYNNGLRWIRMGRMDFCGNGNMKELTMSANGSVTLTSDDYLIVVKNPALPSPPGFSALQVNLPPAAANKGKVYVFVLDNFSMVNVPGLFYNGIASSQLSGAAKFVIISTGNTWVTVEVQQLIRTAVAGLPAPAN